jgi:hypothetical protein
MNRLLSKAIKYIKPDSQFVLVNGSITEWHSEGEPPSEAEIAAAIQIVQTNELIEQYRVAVQNHIDETARSRGYDSGFALATYLNDPVEEEWAQEAGIFVRWRSTTWKHVFVKLNKIQSGEDPIPESIEELISDLPTIEW